MLKDLFRGWNWQQLTLFIVWEGAIIGCAIYGMMQPHIHCH
jgi:hypothetical protein